MFFSDDGSLRARFARTEAELDEIDSRLRSKHLNPTTRADLQWERAGLTLTIKNIRMFIAADEATETDRH